MVWGFLHPVGRAEDSHHGHAHRPQTLQMQSVPQGLHHLQPAEGAHENSHRLDWNCERLHRLDLKALLRATHVSNHSGSFQDISPCLALYSYTISTPACWGCAWELTQVRLKGSTGQTERPHFCRTTQWFISAHFALPCNTFAHFLHSSLLRVRMRTHTGQTKILYLTVGLDTCQVAMVHFNKFGLVLQYVHSTCMQTVMRPVDLTSWTPCAKLRNIQLQVWK